MTTIRIWVCNQINNQVTQNYGQINSNLIFVGSFVIQKQILHIIILDPFIPTNQDVANEIDSACI